MTELTCFKKYDIRGRLDIDLDEEIAFRIGRAFARALSAKTVVLGRDVRTSSGPLAASVAKALVVEGCRVLDIGLSGTEEMYFATSHLGADGGVCVTASHNPLDYNGMKMVRRNSAPLDADTGLATIKQLAEANDFGPAKALGTVVDVATAARAAYVDRVVSLVDFSAIRPLKVLVNAGHGAAGPTFDAIANRLALDGVPIDFVRLFHDPDETFPQGIPNPLLPENQPPTSAAVLSSGADFGVAWDGDFDRCFFFDHRGHFVEGEYVVGLLAEIFLRKSPGSAIVHDPRVVLNTLDVVSRLGGRPVQSCTGHAFVKQKMRDEEAVYGGEMSAHHYFKDFFYCDSGMIPWLLMAELVSSSGALFDLIERRRALYPSSGEINFRVDDPQSAMLRVRGAFGPHARAVDEMDGLSLDMGDWRFNLRGSNTEPVLRLNVEARSDRALVTKGVQDISALVNG